jgi:hypothetical protein
MYDGVMKYVVLAIFVLIASQPLQVSSCEMNNAQQTSQHGSHDMDHDDGSSMDCCDHDPSVPSDNCDSQSHCGAYPTSVMAISALTINVIFKSNTRLFLPDTGEPQSSFNPPPFKPPIA